MRSAIRVWSYIRDWKVPPLIGYQFFITYNKVLQGVTPLVFIMYFRVVYAFMAYISLTTDSFTGDGHELLFVASCHPRSSH